MKQAEKIIKKLEDSNLDNKTKDTAKVMIAEWAYGDWQVEIDTSSYPNDAIECFLDKAESLKQQCKKLKDFPAAYCADNLGGGGNWDYVENAWRIAVLYAVGKFTKEEAMEFDKKLWEFGEDPVLIDECEECLDKNKINTDCKDYVKRIVGDCEGIHKETPPDELTRMEAEVNNDTKPKL